jgi:hypothetical protein
MANLDPSANSEQRKGDSAFLPVVIAAGIALIVILAVAAFILKEKGRKLIPKAADPHPNSLSKPAPDLAPPSKVEVSINTPLYFAFTGGSFNLPTISVP